MKKMLMVFSLILIAFIVTGCNNSKKELVYEGKSINVNFKVLNNCKLSTDSSLLTTTREKAIILGKGYKIGIEEDDSISFSKYSGDFSKLKDNFKEEEDYKEIVYNGIKGFQKYYGSYYRYEVYLPVNKDVSLKLNIYADSNNKKDISKEFNSLKVQDILNSVVIKVK